MTQQYGGLFLFFNPQHREAGPMMARLQPQAIGKATALAIGNVIWQGYSPLAIGNVIWLLATA